MEVGIIALLVGILVVLALLVFQRGAMGGVERGLESRMQGFQQSMETQLGTVSQRLSSVEQSIGQSLASTAGTLKDVGTQLGQLSESARQIMELGKNVSQLQDILRPPQIRGGFGELMLDRLLAQILPRENYEMQHRFRNGETVDAAIRLGEGLVPVDSKFPLDNFLRYIQAETDDEKRAALRAFARDVRGHIDAIARKYIHPEEGTFDFALMYIPAENVYYECVVKSDYMPDQESLSSYALEKRVIPVSPNSFYGYLKAIVLGLRGLRVEENARRIVDHLQQLGRDFDRFHQEFEVLGGHISHTKTKYEELDKHVDRLGTAISVPMESGLPELPPTTVEAQQDGSGCGPVA